MSALAAILVLVFVWFRLALTILPVEDGLGYLLLGWRDFLTSLLGSWPLGGELWRPATVGLAALERTLFGNDPSPRMAVSLLLYGLSGWLIGLVTLRLGGGARRAWIAAGLWLLLPAHHATLYWLGARAHLLALLLTLTALALWPRDGQTRWRRIAAGLSCALALAASELGAVAPLLVVAFAILETGRARPTLRASWPVWLVFGLAALWRSVALGGLGGIGAPASPAAALDTVSGLVERATVDPYFGTGWSWLAALGHGLLVLALVFGLVFRRRLDRIALFWPLLWLLGFLPLIVADGYAPRLSLFVGVAVALALATLIDLTWNRFPLRVVLLVLLGVLFAGSALQLRLMADDWRRAGEMVAGLSHEFERPVMGLFSRQALIVYDVPAQIGVAYGVRNYWPLIAGHDEQDAPVRSGGTLDGPALLDALAAPPGDARRLVWRDARLMLLEWSQTTPDGLAIEIDGCAGELELDELLITLANGATQRIADFRQWDLSGKGRLLDATRLMIASPPLRLSAPAARQLPLNQAVSLSTRIARADAGPACELRLVSHDPQSAAGHGRRVISKRFDGPLDWRLSGLDPAFRSLWRHAALVDVLDDLKPYAAKTPVPGSRLRAPQGQRADLVSPSVIEGVRLIPYYGPFEERQIGEPFLAEIWGVAPDGAAWRLLSERRVSLPRKADSSVTVPLASNIQALAAIAVMIEGDEPPNLSFIELLRPLDWPPLEAAR